MLGTLRGHKADDCCPQQFEIWRNIDYYP